MDWKEELLEAFKLGKTIQCNHNNLEEWHDYVPHNQIDRPNLGYGTKENWRIKPTADEERKEILEKSGTFKITPMMEEIIREEEEKQSNKKYSKDEMLLFGGFCIGRRATAPGISGSELWNEWSATFGKNG
jgi:hypothetical protein